MDLDTTVVVEPAKSEVGVLDPLISEHHLSACLALLNTKMES